jgi:4a-hydroxytetrahydrobiopterin dehydratase
MLSASLKGDTMKLAEQTCMPIKAGDPPLTAQEVEDLISLLPKWSLKEKTITREFRFKDFRQAMDFANKTAEVANDQDHHPDILISYNTVLLTFTTHKIKGLSMNDFIAAARIDLLVDQ